MDRHSLECLDFFRVRELLAGYAHTALGRGLTLSLEPAVAPDLIRRWFEQTRELQKLIEERGAPPFGGVRDVRASIARCAPPLRVTVEEVAQIGDTLAATHVLTRWLANLGPSYPELQRLASRIGDFGVVAGRIGQVIDERGEVRDDASPKLLKIRRRIEAARAEIVAGVTRLLQQPETRRLLTYANYTFHNDRLVLPLRMECRGRLPGIVHRSSDSGATIFVEPAQAVELNNEISNLRAAETEEINHLLWDLAHEIFLNAEPIITTLDAIAVLDLVSAKTRFAKAFRAKLPEILDEPRLRVRGARHPVLVSIAIEQEAQGKIPSPIVPIDYRLGEDFDQLVITGPNTGGKTVTLKTIGLLTLLVQTGIPAPVEDGSAFGVFKRVLIDIGDEQNMQQSLSTFSAHLTRQLDMLQKACPSSLILVDELGAGTDPDEGAAIGRTLLEELVRLGSRCVATTHLGALKSFPLKCDRAENACVEFDMETLKPTYHLIIGQPGHSNAIDIARRLGMPKRLVAAAHSNLSRRAKALREAIKQTSSAKRDAEDARKQADDARVAATHALRGADEAKALFQRQQQDFEKWVRRVVHLQPGDAVRVRNWDRDGKIVRVRLDRQRAEVNVGTFTIEAPLGDILPPEAPAPPPAEPREKPDTPREKRPRGPVITRKSKRRAGAGADSGRREGGRPARSRAGDGARGPSPSDPDRKPIPPLTEQAAKDLRPGDELYVKRFHRRGKLVRLDLARGVAIVSTGLMEVEAPFSGLALPAAAEATLRERKKTRESVEAKVEP